VRSALEQLPYYLARVVRVRTAFHFDQRGNPILVEKQVIDGSSVACLGAVRHALIAASQKPARRFLVVNLVAGEKIRVPGDEVAETIFVVVLTLLRPNE
jgi:hypothetical protein